MRRRVWWTWGMVRSSPWECGSIGRLSTKVLTLAIFVTHQEFLMHIFGVLQESRIRLPMNRGLSTLWEVLNEELYTAPISWDPGQCYWNTGHVPVWRSPGYVLPATLWELTATQADDAGRLWYQRERLASNGYVPQGSLHGVSLAIYQL